MNKDHINRNFRKHLGQFQPESTRRVFRKLDADDIISLLEQTRPPASRRATRILNDLSKFPWTISSTAKEGGKDPTAPLHITIQVPIKTKKPQYHLNCRETPDGALYIYEISRKGLVKDE